MTRSVLCLICAVTSGLAATLAPIPKPDEVASALQITAPAQPSHPFTVAGKRGAILGRQNGVFEAWVWPVKILSDFRIRAEIADYPVPIDVNALSAEVEVTPAETIITYSHAAFTIRQHMFGTKDGVAAFFEIHAIRKMEIWFSFAPQMLKMWPAPNYGIPNAEWVQKGGSGAYVLHTDNPDFSAVIAMPRTEPGVMVPYQEHPQRFATEFKLAYDPKNDAGLVFPLVMQMAAKGNAVDDARAMIDQLPQAYAATQDYYKHFFDKRLTVQTPDHRVDEALKWAEISIDQAQVARGDETGLIAGYYESAYSARPGYAWFFGRDTLFTTYAVNSYGDFALTKKALEFLLARQRDDGKIMHEYSQAADSIDWKHTPYFYASADSTPLLIMAMWDYVRSSGDAAFLKAHWAEVTKAWKFMAKHEDADGMYSNAEGTAWVESWPTGMPKKEIYLAVVDQQAAQAMGHLSQMMKEPSDAAKKAISMGDRIESEYASSGFYAFSDDNGHLDNTATIYPSLAWWDGDFALKHSGEMLTRWASDEFSTDWGTRDISPKTSFYDPISYHQGSIWPLFTGWVSLAEYRAGRPLAGYAHLMQNVNLTWEQDLGSVTELLSGEYYQPLGRSSSHQLWSSAMVITPLVRGLFGIQTDAEKKTITVAPNLPENWDHASLSHIALGSELVDVDFRRSGANVIVSTESAVTLCFAQVCQQKSVTVPLPAIELAIPASVPMQGAMTTALKAISEEHTPNSVTYILSAPGKSIAELPVLLHQSAVTVTGGTLQNDLLRVEFPDGAGYQQKQVQFKW